MPMRPSGILSDDEDDAPRGLRASARVTPAAPQPRQASRSLREGQRSFIDPEGFELPSVHLLAEPRHVARDATLSADALEQNARMLEGVLEDFGVKGEIIHVRPGPVVTLYELEPAPASSPPASSAWLTTLPAP